MGNDHSAERRRILRERHCRKIAREMIREYGTPFVSKQILLSHGLCRGNHDVDFYFAHLERVYDRDRNVFLDAYINETFDDLGGFGGPGGFNQGGFNNRVGGGGFNQGGFNQGGFGGGGFNQGGFNQGDFGGGGFNQGGFNQGGGFGGGGFNQGGFNNGGFGGGNTFTEEIITTNNNGGFGNGGFTEEVVTTRTGPGGFTETDVFVEQDNFGGGGFGGF